MGTRRCCIAALVALLVAGGCAAQPGGARSVPTGTGAESVSVAPATDGGPPPDPPNPSVAGASVGFDDVTFVGRTGWVTGQRCPAAGGACTGFVRATSDGGQTWGSAVSLGQIRPERIVFVGAATGWVLATTPCRGAGPCPTTLLQSTDGGHTWLARETSPEPLGHLQFVDASHGFALGGVRTDCGADLCGAPLLATSDGGATWRAVATGAVTGVLALDFPTPLVGWIVGLHCGGTPRCSVVIAATANGGRNWRTRLKLPASDYEATSGAALLTFAAGGERGWALLPVPNGCTMGGCWGSLYATGNGGRTWGAIQPALHWSRAAQAAPPGWVARLAIATPSSGWIAAQSGAGPGDGGLWRTVDAGATWDKVLTGWSISDVAPISGDQAWAVGWPSPPTPGPGGPPSGAVLHTTDGGGQWQVALP